MPGSESNLCHYIFFHSDTNEIFDNKKLHCQELVPALCQIKYFHRKKYLLFFDKFAAHMQRFAIFFKDSSALNWQICRSMIYFYP
jgi:hypothetical protein